MTNSQLPRSILPFKHIYRLCLVGAVITLFFTFTAQLTSAREVMTDRCSNEVAIPPAYDAPLAGPGTVILKRGANGWSNWVQFRVQVDSSGHIRWWCHSTTGNWLDPGTWRIQNANAGAVCSFDGSQVSNCKPTGANLQFGSSVWQGWTPERSRCSDHSTVINARLGPNRLLSIACLGH